MTTAEITSVTMPPGLYWVGDPCYSIPDGRWMEWLEDADYINVKRLLVADLDGHPVLGISTAYGDGQYLDGEGYGYGVDSGMIGVVPHEVSIETTHSQLVHFNEPFTCEYDEGVIVLGHIRINTDDESDDSEGEWYE